METTVRCGLEDNDCTSSQVPRGHPPSESDQQNPRGVNALIKRRLSRVHSAAANALIMRWSDPGGQGGRSYHHSPSLFGTEVALVWGVADGVLERRIRDASVLDTSHRTILNYDRSYTSHFSRDA